MATFESAEALLIFEAERLDAVFICVPPNAHGDIENLAVNSQTPMFIEKPLAHDLATAEDLALRIAGRVAVAVGYQWRQLSFLPEVLERLSRTEPNLVVA